MQKKCRDRINDFFGEIVLCKKRLFASEMGWGEEVSYSEITLWFVIKCCNTQMSHSQDKGW